MQFTECFCNKGHCGRFPTADSDIPADDPVILPDGIFSNSGSGGFALSAAQVDVRIKAVVTAALVDISGNRNMIPEDQQEAVKRSLCEQRWKDFENGTPEVNHSFPETVSEKIPDEITDPMARELFSYDDVTKIPFDKIDDFLKESLK